MIRSQTRPALRQTFRSTVFLAFTSLLILAAPVRAQEPANDDLTLTDEQHRLVLEGIRLHDEGAYEQARERYRSARGYGEHPVIEYQIAYAYQHEGRIEECVEHAARSAEWRSTVRVQALGMLGACLDLLGRHAEALEVLAAGIAEDPSFVLLHHSKAVVQSKLGDRDAAIGSLFDAVAVDPTHAGSHLLLAGLRQERGERAAALLGLSFFLMLETDSPRSADAASRIIEILEPPVVEHEVDGRATTLIGVPDASDSRLIGLETTIAISAAARGALERELDRSEVQGIASQYDLIFSALVGLEAPEEAEDPVWRLYIPVFADLHQSGHTEPFVYLLLQASDLDGIDEWVEANLDVVDDFLEWITE